MKRIVTVLTLAALMAAMLLASALPVLAIPPPTTPGQFTCILFDEDFNVIDEQQRVPRGQVAIYDAAGYICFRSGQFG
jgi:hypothetical protein